MSARFNLGQGMFSALCGYLVVDGRRAAARQLAHSLGMTLRQCRAAGALDMPTTARARGVSFASGTRAPFAVVIRAPRGSETTWSHITRTAKFVPGRKTTTPTVSVAVVKYTSLDRLVSPQAMDCSLPAKQRAACVAAARAFVSETLLTSFGWSASKSAAAGRKVAKALG